VGIRAPRETAVIAMEVKLVRDENLAAANGDAGEFSSLIERWGPVSQALSRAADKVAVRQEAGTKH
jgi:hypothetical protein